MKALPPKAIRKRDGNGWWPSRSRSMGQMRTRPFVLCRSHERNALESRPLLMSSVLYTETWSFVSPSSEPGFQVGAAAWCRNLCEFSFRIYVRNFVFFLSELVLPRHDKSYLRRFSDKGPSWIWKENWRRLRNNKEGFLQYFFFLYIFALYALISSDILSGLLLM